jgi:hypothetical protein
MAKKMPTIALQAARSPPTGALAQHSATRNSLTRLTWS